LDQVLAFGRHAGGLPLAFLLCVFASLFALDLTRNRARLGGRIVAASLLGAAIWTAPFLSASWPGNVAFHPLLLALSLACADGATFWALVVYSRTEGYLHMIGPGAILGAGAGLSHATILFAIGGAQEGLFDDAPLCAGVAIASACAVLAFVVLCRGRRHAELLAAISLAIGTTACGALAGGALTLGPAGPGGRPFIAISAGLMALVAPGLVIALLAAAAWLRWAALRPATTATAWRGNRRPSPASSRAETASLRPAPARSAAVQAAGPARPTRQAH
jgi:NO-binding membrane sensor protein with MHYT domain